MSTIFKSASKLVFVLVAITLCAAFLAVVFNNLKEEKTVMAVIVLAASCITAAFTYYFTKYQK